MCFFVSPHSGYIKWWLKRYQIDKHVYKKLCSNLINASYDQKDIIFYAIDTCLRDSNFKNYQQMCHVYIRIWSSK